MLYLYCLTDARPLREADGISGAPVRALTWDGVAAVVSEHDVLDLVATEERLWEHESVLEALMDGGPVLPVRFGVTFAGPGQVQRELERRHEIFASALERVRGRVEVGVRVLAPEAAPPERVLPGMIVSRFVPRPASWLLTEALAP
jgi:hypothetical protein